MTRGKPDVFVFLTNERGDSTSFLASQMGWVCVWLAPHTQMASLPSCRGLLFWRNKCQKISFWSKSGSFWECCSHQSRELSHRPVSFPGRKCDSEGMQLQSLSPREAEPGGELCVRNTVLLLGNVFSLWHQSHTHQWALEQRAPQTPNSRTES